MILHSRSKPHRFVERPVYSGAASFQEGTALVHIAEGGLGKVAPSAGSSELFMGLAWSFTKIPTSAPMVETGVIPASSPYTVALKETPLNPTTDFFVAIAGVAGTYDATPDATGDFWEGANGKTLTVHSDDAGKAFYAVYRYSLTVERALFLYGDNYHAGNRDASTVTGSVGVVTQGLIFTDKFHTGVDWTASGISDIKTGAGGLLTRAGSGSAVAGKVIFQPSVDVPYLGIDFTV